MASHRGTLIGIAGLNGPNVPLINSNLSPLKFGWISMSSSSAKNSFSAGVQLARFIFQKFYNALSDKNFLIYPGKLTVADTFRIGCIGNLNDQDMKDTLVAVKEVVSDLKINL